MAMNKESLMLLAAVLGGVAVFVVLFRILFKIIDLILPSPETRLVTKAITEWASANEANLARPLRLFTLEAAIPDTLLTVNGLVARIHFSLDSGMRMSRLNGYRISIHVPNPQKLPSLFIYRQGSLWLWPPVRGQSLPFDGDFSLRGDLTFWKDHPWLKTWARKLLRTSNDRLWISSSGLHFETVGSGFNESRIRNMFQKQFDLAKDWLSGSV